MRAREAWIPEAWGAGRGRLCSWEMAPFRLLAEKEVFKNSWGREGGERRDRLKRHGVKQPLSSCGQEDFWGGDSPRLPPPQAKGG